MNININRLHISNIRVRAASPQRAPSNTPPRPSGREHRVDTALEQLFAATDQLQREVARLAQPRNGRNHPDEPGSFRANIAEHRARVTPPPSINRGNRRGRNARIIETPHERNASIVENPNERNVIHPP